MIEITEKEISLEELIKRARSRDAGAVVTFLGMVRDDGIEKLEVEAFREAALAELENIQKEAMSRFALKAVEIVHRTGTLVVGESIVAIVCSAGHREEAFSGCRYIIEELKKRAPLWKKELGERGEHWVGQDEPAGK
ncbi:MAG: molybdenum cofactor biosynthesis protein MoaE [Methanothrix sp.]|nr:molybdenum cofactor biosynthesis protein MoaE [Methanothrix sp.]MDD4446934.1 molybdenum cofactor biosynthesis protein MoaE [Methanothrix sp.]